jgi:hypothetical protein
MSRSHKEDRFSDDLQEVADVLRDQRPALTPLELDRIKLRAMSATRRSTSPGKGFFMRSRLTTALTIGFLTLGTGGAMALYGGGGGFEGDHGGSASFHQYRECDHGNGRGKDHECHGHEGDGGGGGGDKGKGGGGGGDKGHGNSGHGH